MKNEMEKKKRKL